MYIAPRPLHEDDPYYALRLALGTCASLLVAFVIETQMAMLLPIVFVALMGSIRKAFDIKKAVLNPLILVVVTLLFYGLLSYTHVKPSITIPIVFLISVFGYFLTLKTGNPVGMLILILIVFMSVMGAKSTQALLVLRDGFVEALLSSALLIPLLYGLLPTRATEPLKEVFQPDLYGRPLERAILRAIVLMLLLAWLYTFLDQGSMLLAIAAIFALMFPCKEHQFQEAKERSYATLIGGTLALVILVIVGYVGQLAVLLLLTLLVALFLGDKMVHGRNPPMVYQFALSGCMALVVSSLANQSPLQLTFMRIVLTLVGTMGAAFLYAALEGLLFKVLPSSFPAEVSDKLSQPPQHTKNPD